MIRTWMCDCYRCSKIFPKLLIYVALVTKDYQSGIDFESPCLCVRLQYNIEQRKEGWYKLFFCTIRGRGNRVERGAKSSPPSPQKDSHAPLCQPACQSLGAKNILGSHKWQNMSHFWNKVVVHCTYDEHVCTMNVHCTEVLKKQIELWDS